MRLVSAAVPQVKNSWEILVLPSGYAGGPTIFLRHRLREGNREDFSLREIRLSRDSSSQRKVAFKLLILKTALWRHLCIVDHEFQPTYVELSDTDVCAVSGEGLALSTCTRETIHINAPKGEAEQVLLATDSTGKSA